MGTENEIKPLSRKKVIFWSVGVVSVVSAAANFLRPSSQAKKTETVKMLSEDGRLVEVEISKLPAKRKKIKDTDIHTWVKGKPIL